MSTVIVWIGRHLSFGGLLRNLMIAAGYVAFWALYLALLPVGLINRDFIRETYLPGLRRLRIGAIKLVCAVGEVSGTLLNTVIYKISSAIGFILSAIAKQCGCTTESTDLVKKLGTVFGALVIGFSIGVGLADLMVGLAAAPGTAGAAATTSGLAGLGGGSVAVGGGGMAAGQAVVNSVATASSVSGAASAIKGETNSS
ncbi:MAG: hypothetical protein Q8L20_03255 [Gammaproteobacteria bacterium]|nr:hypothetical protein [Gammaproteobacteria bacterium]